MKKISLLLILITQISIAQVKIGEYFSNKKGEKIKLKILDDQNYEMIFLYGKYQQDGSSIKLSQPEESNSFDVNYQTDSSKSNKITVEISGTSFIYYYYSKIYFGTQTNSSSVEYKPLSDLIGDVSNDYGLDKKYTFEIDKTDFFYLVEDNLTEESQIQKYSLPKNVSKIEIIYAVNYLSKLNLSGEINPTTGEISISEGGKSALLFSFKQDNELKNDKIIKPIEKTTEKNWTYSGKKVVDDIYGYPVDSAAVAVDTAYEAKPAYIFKTKVEDNLKSALEVTKKQSDKYFVVFYDKNPETAKTNFDEFIKSYETNAGYYMYDNYLPEYDPFNFYLASKKDKDFIKKFSSEDSVIAIFDSNGNKLYHTKWDQTEAESIFSPYSYTIKTELEPIKSNVSIDQLFSNPKSSSDDIITQLEKLSNITMPYDYSDDVVVAPSATEVVEVREDIKEVEADKTVEDAAKAAEEVAKEASETIETVEPAYDYSLLKEKNNLYKLKSTPESINNKWKQILDKAKIDKDFNYKVAKITNAEVSNIGFNKALFNQDKKLLNSADFSSLDYLIKNYDAIKNYQKTDSLDYSEPLGNVIDYNVTTVLNKNLDKENGADKSHYDKILSYYKKFLAASKNNPTLSKGYMNALKSQDLQIEYLEAYNNYFNSILPNNSNFIEQLDKAYVTKNSYEDWKSYKYNFANTANEASWYVVEKAKDANAIKNAIKWSETSLTIEKENAYFLDTLAQLYYKNGQKEKAIQTQLKAIEKIDQIYEEETKEEMKNVLTKMQNGTY